MGFADTPRFHAPDLDAAAYIRIPALKRMRAARLARCHHCDGYDQTLTRHVGNPAFEITTPVHKNTTECDFAILAHLDPERNQN